ADLPSQITVTGDVPLGTSSGTLVIDDDRLDAPVTVGFTIQRRRWSGLIFLVFLAGGLAGYAIRQRANKIAIQLKLREDGQAGLAALDMLIARSLPKERGLLIKARNAITDALDSTDETRIAPAIAAGNQAASAVADVHTKQLADRTALLASYAALPAMLAIRELAVDLSELPTAVDAINDALTDHDVAAAERGLAKLDARLEARRADLDAWTARLALALAALATKQLPKPIADVWTAPPLSTIRAAQPRSSAMLVVLEAVEPTVRELDTALTGAADALLRLAATATAALSNARAIAHRLADASAMIGGDLPARVDQLAAALAAWYATLHDELTAWKDRAATAADATTGLTALDGGDYGAAMAMLNQLSPPPPPPQSDAPVPRAEHLAPRAHVLAPRPPAAGDPIPTVSDVGGPTHAKLALLRLRRQSRMWTAVQVVFAYIVLPFGAWAGFHDAFVGTAAELIALGATGFVTDFTADAAIAKLQSLKG
ncbi:MAG TPA: hypothetical protein VH165_34935, partial [Kofleriaceae bacterium]|nr:hypothetical protein [Kofleriaceae bacterium]